MSGFGIASPRRGVGPHRKNRCRRQSEPRGRAAHTRIEDSPEEKLIVFSTFLDATPHIELPKNQEAENLALIYASENVLSDKHLDDLTHVAYAVASRCDYVISWNMKHMVNPRTVARVNEVNTLNNLPR